MKQASLESRSAKTESVHDVLRRLASDFPDQSAIIDGLGHSTSYAQLWDWQESLRKTLLELGCRSHHRVGIFVENRAEQAHLLLGVLASCVAMPMNAGLKEFELLQLIEATQLDLILVDESLHAKFSHVMSQARIPVGLIGRSSDHRPVVRKPNATIAAKEKTDTHLGPGLLLMTSGTTARPKLVVLTHQNLLYSAHATSAHLGLTSKDVGLCVLPLNHVGGIVPGFLAGIVAGGAACVPTDFNASGINDLVQAARPTWMSAVPSLYRVMLRFIRKNERHEADHAFKFLRVGAAALDSALAKELYETFRVPIVQAYALTESAGLATSFQWKGSGPVTVGSPLGTEVRIFEDGRGFLPQGQQGEIVIKGPSVFSGYVTDEGSDRSAFVDGWFRTGDLGSLGPDSQLTILGRQKEMINRAGESISPFEIEEALLKHPAVEQAAVFGVSDPAVGEEVNAAVILRKGESIGAAELSTWAAQKLADSKVPKRVHFVDEFPKTQNGKIRRAQLTEMFQVAPSQEPAPTAASGSAHVDGEIQKLFSSILGFDVTDLSSSFFDLGGDSILGATLILKTNQQYGIQTTVVDLYLNPSVQEFAKLVSDKRSNPEMIGKAS